MYSCSGGFVFQIGDAVVCHAHLLFKNGDPLGKVVVCADLAGQFFQLSVGYCLCGGHALFGAPLPAAVVVNALVPRTMPT